MCKKSCAGSESVNVLTLKVLMVAWRRSFLLCYLVAYEKIKRKISSDRIYRHRSVSASLMRPLIVLKWFWWWILVSIDDWRCKEILVEEWKSGVELMLAIAST